MQARYKFRQMGGITTGEGARRTMQTVATEVAEKLFIMLAIKITVIHVLIC
jgi:hypothetical protein